jgi:adenylylsulfate kinase
MKGIYVLLLSVFENISVSVGSLGVRSFPKGFYAYVGSAQNSLEKRVKRHLRRVKPKFWHIDYLLSNRHVEILGIFYEQAGRAEECSVAERLAKTATSVAGFGSSDCSCIAHLFRVEACDYLSEFVRELGLKPFREVVSAVKTGWCVWITGLPGSGKSTVAAALLELLEKEGLEAQLLSSDALRKVLTPKPSYSLEERNIVYETLVYIAELLTRNGVNVVIDATGNLKRYRDNAREKIEAFIEVYLECPLEVCRQREAVRTERYHSPKQIYKRAEKGEAPTVPGMGQPYEASPDPEVTVDTRKCSPAECARKVLKTVLRAKETER